MKRRRPIPRRDRCIKVTEEGRFVRCRYAHPELFQRKSFRTLTARRGVKIVIGRRRGQQKASLQAILFDRRIYHA